MIYRIIIPTLSKKCLIDCLKAIKNFTTQEYTIDLITDGDTWAEAVNIGIYTYPEEDIILMDDDIIVSKGWLDNIETLKKRVDIIGWSLKRPDGTMQFTGSYLYRNSLGTILMENYRDVIKKARKTINASTSCVYIKRTVFDEIGDLDDATYKYGCHYEDTDFCMRAIKADFKILVNPNIVLHEENFTKKDFVDFKKRVANNGLIFYTKLNKDVEYIKKVESGIKAQPLK